MASSNTTPEFKDGSTNNLEENVKLMSINSKGNGSLNGLDNVDGKSGGVTLPKGNLLPPGYAMASSNVNDEAYDMKHLHRGHCVIFNHKHFHEDTGLGVRHGTDRDRDSMSLLFKTLGFKVDVRDDLTLNGIKGVLDHYSTLDHSDNDCFVIVFMSHGEEGSMLFCRDNLFKSDLLFDQFTADNCTTLAGKPKMFFIQACRGDGLDPGTRMVKTEDEPDGGNMSLYKIPNQADFLMCWSTVPGHYSWRNTTNGSWFMQSLNKVFTQRAPSFDVLTMMTKVNCYMIQHFQSNCPTSPEMHGKMQSASIVSTLMREVYLSPKH